MKLRLLFCVLACLLSVGQNPLCAQEASKYTLSIKDSETKKPIADAVCRVFTASDQAQTYSLANKQGEVSLSADSHSAYVSISLLGYRKQRVEIRMLQQRSVHTVYLSKQDFNLREVVVKAQPIKRKSDTLVYNASSFVDQSDQYLADMLKKLPGVSVADDGTLSYQGKSINKFYIEGKDLLGSRYNQASQNMPVEAVSQIQVLENHQPIKALKDKTYSDNAAINVKLKKGFLVRPFGEAKGGIGGSPAIYDNTIFLMQLLPRNQLMLTAQMNNRGRDLSSTNKEHINVMNIESYLAEPYPFLSIDNLFISPLSPQRYLRNKSFSASLNDLVDLGKNSEMRLGITAYSDRRHADNLYHFETLDAVPITIRQQSYKKNKHDVYTPELKYELNANKIYVLDELKTSFSRLSQSMLMQDNDRNITQNQEYKPSKFQNNLKASFSASKLTYDLTSLIQYNNEKEWLDFAQGETAQNPSLRQNHYKQKELYTYNKISTIIPLEDNKYSLSIGGALRYKDSRYTSFNAGSNERGEAQVQSLHSGILPDILWRYSSAGHISFSLPVMWTSLRLQWDRKVQDRNDFVSCAPHISWKSRLTDEWTMRLGASYEKREALDEYYSPILLLRNYRTEVSLPTKLYTETLCGSVFNLNYQNLINMLFMDLTCSYTRNRKESLPNYQYAPSFTLVGTKDSVYYGSRFISTYSIDKSFTDHGLSFKFSGSYTLMDYLIAQQGEVFKNKSNNLMYTLSSNFKKIKWLKITYDVMGIHAWNINGGRSSEVFSRFANDVSIYCFPSKQWDLQVSYENTITEIAARQYKQTHMLDFGIKYRMNKQLQFHANVYNLFNSDSYEEVSYSNANRISYSMPLRGREFLLTCLFKL
ncbi:hypothetical protein [Porphyromonas pogonae]|uniref:hypothetical protein n=1 Tax=Porphyromonas pogonae TaxID=867595 RepID=UPI002E75BAF8|nr:hypothetical protein [Porphyromonas pogonae]